ncbi:hypothetical protein SNE40_009688 [Patella caerulea]|uniref:RNase H type-1 domain-containing protein n=1 Tax=Patella caerulea TaxID=87958 RepID=A0AAN8JUL5_PATCE
MEVRLPQDKLDKLRSKLLAFLNMKTNSKVTLRELQSLIGLLNYACYVVSPGRAFLRRIIDLTLGLKRPHHKRRLTFVAKKDMQAWLEFLKTFNGKAFILSDLWKTSESLQFYTDSSNLGFGGIFGHKWFCGVWQGYQLNYHINIRELFPIVLALELYAPTLQNSCVKFYSDNLSVVHILNKQTSKDPIIMRLVRRFMVLILKYNIMFKLFHIPGNLNRAADLLSRTQVHLFQQWYPAMDPIPTPIPHSLLVI